MRTKLYAIKITTWIIFASLGFAAFARDDEKVAKARAEAEIYAQRSIAYSKKPRPKPTKAELKAEELMEEANAIIPECETPEQMEPAIKLYEDATRAAPNYDKAWWGLAMAIWGKAMLMPRDTGEEKQAASQVLDQAEQACNQALKIAPMSTGGNYFLANIILTRASMKNVVQQAFLMPQVFRLTDKVAAVDPYFEYGAVFRTFAAIAVGLPDWLIRSLGFEPEVDLPYLDKAIEMEPNCFVNYISRAGLYMKLGDKASKEKALKDMEYVISHNPDALKGYEADNRARQRDAREVWKQITGRYYPARQP